MNKLKPVLAAASLIVMGSGAMAPADEARVADLLSELQSAPASRAAQIADELQLEWAKSGSASADFLLSRGRKALEAQDPEAAIDHFSALVDHAPGFATGYVERARAYLETGLFGPALQDLEAALGLNPQHFEALSGVALILEMIDRPEAAYDAYLMVRSIHPHHPAVTEALERLEPVVKGRRL
ncbi:hypothetical protein N6L24_15285 [Cognatishimia sp. SS12]|uniref:tetratricopeptide repeat protein n=1 Tax=Cognatishimia sp. SS12 TaxID=2979465 RepID=UPI00232EDCDF|nr:tetratricopeptide repeat protein [Cognatishimia sp. SS12]MDC0739652.1 hypothetical protein [Cognatishimia sp. SS12]